MKILAILAAGTLVASSLAPLPAAAKPEPPRWGQKTKWKTVCTWRGHGRWKHKVCRKVRVRW